MLINVTSVTDSAARPSDVPTSSSRNGTWCTMIAVVAKLPMGEGEGDLPERRRTQRLACRDVGAGYLAGPTGDGAGHELGLRFAVDDGADVRRLVAQGEGQGQAEQ